MWALWLFVQNISFLFMFGSERWSILLIYPTIVIILNTELNSFCYLHNCSGVGFAIAQRLLTLEITLTICLACRNVSKAEKAKSQLTADHPEASIDILQLDTSSISSVSEAAKELQQRSVNILTFHCTKLELVVWFLITWHDSFLFLSLPPSLSLSLFFCCFIHKLDCKKWQMCTSVAFLRFILSMQIYIANKPPSLLSGLDKS